MQPKPTIQATANTQKSSASINRNQLGQPSTAATNGGHTRNHRAQNSTDTNTNGAGASSAAFILSNYLTPHEATGEQKRLWDSSAMCMFTVSISLQFKPTKFNFYCHIMLNLFCSSRAKGRIIAVRVC